MCNRFEFPTPKLSPQLSDCLGMISTVRSLRVSNSEAFTPVVGLLGDETALAQDWGN
ncbi:MAG: hypothetical protein VKK42_20280 [Lyngbya sp.]|nr:hypothetical protein [Lyngbya sp.]